MTREEAIARIKVHKTIHKMSEPRAIYISEALNIAIEALEQDSILDQIRAEIEEYKSRQLALAIGVEDLETGKQIALEHVLAIIDKYEAESEEI